MQGTRQVTLSPFVGPTHVEDHATLTVRPEAGQVYEGGDRVSARQMGVDGSDGAGRRTVDADTRQCPLGFGHDLGIGCEQGQRCTPGHRPTQVGGERIAELDADGARKVRGGEGAPRP